MVPARTNRSGDTRGGADRAFVTGGPADSVTGSVGRLDHLEDLALAGWPAHLLGLDDDPVTDRCRHAATSGHTIRAASFHDLRMVLLFRLT
jgi:hypothetical protein